MQDDDLLGCGTYIVTELRARKRRGTSGWSHVPAQSIRCYDRNLVLDTNVAPPHCPNRATEAPKDGVVAAAELVEATVLVDGPGAVVEVAVLVEADDGAGAVVCSYKDISARETDSVAIAYLENGMRRNTHSVE